MRIGVLELLTDTPTRGCLGRLYADYFRRQFVSIMPQVVSVWCRQLGHTAHYATYYGQDDPLSLIPAGLDLVFIATYTQASALAYALAKVFRRRGVRTVIGGPHAKAFPVDCLRFFDLVVKDCDKTLIAEILRDRASGPAVVSSGRPLAELPSVAERMPEIAASAFSRGRPTLTSLVPILSSIGCPYSCNFCIDWNTSYVPLPKERLKSDLEFLATRYPQVLVGYHDPNFAVRFDETMDTIESVPGARRNRYIMESSLSVLKPERLHRLKSTRCAYVAPGIESWVTYSNKAGVGAKRGADKLREVLGHFETLHRYVPGLQANFLFGGDDDRGEEPAELTKEFIRKAPFVFPAINIPTPFGGTPLFDQLLAEGRVLRSMPFALYYNPFLVTQLRHYEPAAYYGHLIDIYATITSVSAVARRALARSGPVIKFINELRSLVLRRETAQFKRLQRRFLSDRSFLAFHEGRSADLPTLPAPRSRSAWTLCGSPDRARPRSEAPRAKPCGERAVTERAITLAFIGDVMLGRGVSAMLSSHAPESFWGDVLPVMRSADAVIANLESPITEAASEWHRTWKAFRFRASPAAVEVLRAGNIRCVNLANNHALDYGEDGLIETLERLDAAGIVHAGAGHDLAGAIRPALFDAGGARVGLIGLTDNMSEFAAQRRRPGTNVLRIDDRNVTLGLIDLLVRDLRRAGAGTVVLSVHWGPNLRTWPPMRFQRFARAAVELGIDVVHGHSAHLFQGVEKWGDGLILYDTGDFLDDYWVFPGVRTDRSFIFVVELRNGRPARLFMRPVTLEPGRVGFAKGAEFAATVATMRRRCRSFATPLVANGDGLIMTLPSDIESALARVESTARERGLSPTQRADRC